jgi:RNA polymerase-interacting CarD/CdnL/TRCF family regulator
MAFKRGDCVVHPRHGAGTMAGVRIIVRDGKKRRYHCVELIGDRGTVMIPEEHIADAGLRIAIADVDLIRNVMYALPDELPNDYRIRQSCIREKIASGDPRQLVQALRDLCWRERHKRLNATDTELKTRAFLLITYELAVKSALEVDAARRRLNGIIRKAMQAHGQAVRSAS